ncbi:MarR family transcriptional regulator [Microbacterium sp. NPDC076911]|uniref:MarR family winged helix-turn-helix transcriptional regulator n=1 Tax=Microbacterium sp. NPDC076911 TaxID=3154958 RepID=UPI0034415059
MAKESLDDMLCFSLYAASRAVTQAYRAVLADFDLTYPQFLVVISLDHAGELSVGELGAAMQLDSGTLSPLVQRLESRGFLTRERRVGNERVVVVALTEAGRALRRDVSLAVECLPEAYGIKRDEIVGLLDQLHRITVNMGELTTSLRSPAPA